MGFGDFSAVCTRAALPLCPLVGVSAVSGSAGIQPACYARTIQLANTIIFEGAAAFVHIAALLMTVIMILHVRSKFTAVGRREILTVFYVFFLLVVFSLLLDAGVVGPGSAALPYFVAVQIGLAGALCVALLLNGFVGFQLYEDGTLLSVWVLRGVTAAWAFVLFLVALLTFKGVGGLSPQHTAVLWVLMYVVDALALAVYAGSQVFLVLGTLQDRWPLGDIAFGVFFFVIGQVVLYALGETVCEAAQHYLDGLFFSSLCNLLAVMMIYKFWDSITTEDLEFSVGARTNNWEVKDYAQIIQDDGYADSLPPPPARGSLYAGGYSSSGSTLNIPVIRHSAHDKSDY